MKGARLIAGLTSSLALTGLLLCYTSLLGTWRLAVGVVIVHVLAACLLLILVLPFLWRHIRGRGRLNFNNAAMLALLGAMLLSGVALTVVGRRGHLPALHWVSSLAFVVAMFRHARFGLLTPVLNNRSLIFKLAGIAVLLAGIAFVSLTLKSEGVLAREQIPFTSMAIVGVLPAYDRASMAPENCAACHAKEVEEWRQSLHAVSDTEIIYGRVVGEFREQHGIEASNWCAACHSPLRLARGELNIKVADVEQPNVGCIACHSIQEIHEPVGSNSYDLAVKTEKTSVIGTKLGLSNRMLLLQPGAHRGRWNVGLTQRPEFCGACHRQILPESLTSSRSNLTLQDTFGEWLESRFNSPNPGERKTCQDCHMPTTQNLRSVLGLEGRSHVFAGASADIAQLSGARTRLKEVKQLLANTASLA
ncbi:MAG: multiheme c-type cytochrome, partial [Pyrinomonadaceae bacterium]